MSRVLQAINPATGEFLASYPEMEPAEIAGRIAHAEAAFQLWRRRPIAERLGLLKMAGSVLRRGQVEHARLMAMEMGKPVTQGLAEVEKCARTCDYYAEEAAGFLAVEEVRTEFQRSCITFEPLGVLLAVMPWNFPFWQVFRAAVPALAAGNTCLLKHASNVPGCALAIERVFREAGLPSGVFQTLLAGSSHVPEMIAHPVVAAVTLTGSTPAGRAVAAQAGAALKKTVLELGGSDPYVILEDADLEIAARACVEARLINTGQSCIAAKRFIVVSQARDGFTEKVVEKMRSRRTGDPLEPGTTLGPLARHDLRDALHDQVQRSIAQGAKLLLGGAIPAGPGAFYPATVLSEVRPGMAVYDEETFGPVAAIVEAQDSEEAIRLANGTAFGLGAAVFTRNRERGERIARESLEAGCCFVNDFVRSDPRLPFGGVRQSGYGRELGAVGIREFVNAKTVCVR